MNIACVYGQVSDVEVNDNAVKFRVLTVVGKDRKSFVPVCCFKLTQEMIGKLKNCRNVLVKGTIQETEFEIGRSRIVSCNVIAFPQGITIT